ncbi:MAG: hypothetical protein GF329_16080 [Candidatus Lokiarchaeota archaeon]|nr:hypothetical protein [Candidatus Lokiarchaeota archaeon]
MPNSTKSIKNDSYSNILTIDILKDKNNLKLHSEFKGEMNSLVISKPEKEIFERCKSIDKIMLNANDENISEQIIKKLQNEIKLLSHVLLKPIDNLIMQSDLINIIVSDNSIKIPFEFLSLNKEFLYKRKPIVFSYEKITPSNIEEVKPTKGYIISDSSADPEFACESINKKIPNSYFYHVKNAKIDELKTTLDYDFILMSVHGEIDPDTYEAYLKIRNEVLYPRDFSQENLKLIYFDSCHLGIAKNFVDHFRSLNAQYYIAPIIANEAGNSSTKTILTFFKYLDDNTPIESIFKTKKDLSRLSSTNILHELFFAASFRLYKLN